MEEKLRRRLSDGTKTETGQRFYSRLKIDFKPGRATLLCDRSTKLSRDVLSRHFFDRLCGFFKSMPDRRVQRIGGSDFRKLIFAHRYVNPEVISIIFSLQLNGG